MVEPINSSLSNTEVLANAYYGVYEETPETTFGQRLAGLPAELAVGIPFSAGMVAYGHKFTKPFSVWAQNKKTNEGYFTTWKKMTEQAKKETEHLTKDKGFFEGFKNKQNYQTVKTLESGLPTFNTDPKKANNAKNLYNKEISKHYNKAKRLIQEAKAQKLTGPALEAKIKEILKAIGQGDKAVNNLVSKGKLIPPSRFGKGFAKFKHGVKSKAGVYKLKGSMYKTVGRATRASAALKNVARCGKGNAIFAVIGGLMEIPNLMSASEADKHARANGKVANNMSRQVMKSASKVGGSIIGYALGSAAAGAVAGSVCPGLGNIAGAVIGFIGGCIGALVTGKVVDHFAGEKSAAEDYSDAMNKTNTKTAQQLAKDAEKNPEIKDELLASLYEGAQKGEITDENVLNVLEEEINKRNAEIAQAQQQTQQIDQSYASTMSTLNSLNYAA